MSVPIYLYFTSVHFQKYLLIVRELAGDTRILLIRVEAIYVSTDQAKAPSNSFFIQDNPILRAVSCTRLYFQKTFGTRAR